MKLLSSTVKDKQEKAFCPGKITIFFEIIILKSPIAYPYQLLPVSGDIQLF
jgi:hypothetical protein